HFYKLLRNGRLGAKKYSPPFSVTTPFLPALPFALTGTRKSKRSRSLGDLFHCRGQRGTFFSGPCPRMGSMAPARAAFAAFCAYSNCVPMFRWKQRNSRPTPRVGICRGS